MRFSRGCAFPFGLNVLISICVFFVDKYFLIIVIFLVFFRVIVNVVNQPIDFIIFFFFFFSNFNKFDFWFFFRFSIPFFRYFSSCLNYRLNNNKFDWKALCVTYLGCERFVTYCAFEWSLFCVRTIMDFQRRLTCECFEANLTCRIATNTCNNAKMHLGKEKERNKSH